MRGIYDIIVKPSGSRYNNSKSIGNKSLILNTEIFNHQYINREAEVIEVPVVNLLNLSKGDLIVLHHNVFRRWHDVKAREKNSRSYLREGEYFVQPNQVFLTKAPGAGWECVKGYCFVQPIKTIDKLSLEEERPLMGVVKYSDGTVSKGDMVGFTPGDEFEFVVDGRRMYRVMSKFITIKYEYQGDEEEYNPSWAKSS